MSQRRAAGLSQAIAIRIALATALAMLLAACSADASPPGSTPAGGAPLPAGPAPTGAASVPPANLTVFAAASLKAALTKAVQTYAAEHAGTTIALSTDSSAALETKIEQAAPADVFLSADTTNPQKLVEAGLATGTVQVFARNKLTVVVPSGNPAGIEGPVDLARSGIKVVAAGDSVPITTYANQLVSNLASQPGYPAGFAAAYEANIVSKEDNVAAVISKIELGEGDAAIVYATDAVTITRVQVVSVPDSANVIATYGGVVVKASGSRTAAAAFLAWLTGSEGQAVLATFGFLARA